MSENARIADKVLNSLRLNVHDKCPRCHGEECSYCEGCGYIYNELGLETRHKLIEALDKKDAKDKSPACCEKLKRAVEAYKDTVMEARDQGFDANWQEFDLVIDQGEQALASSSSCECGKMKEYFSWVMEIIPHSFWIENKGRREGYAKIKEMLK